MGSFLNSILTFLQKLFTQDFMPHGQCYLWMPEVLWTQVISDALIGAAYLIIPGALIYFTKKRDDLAPFNKVFMLFTAFILACGFTHFLEIYVAWVPIYRFTALVKAITAIISVITAVMAWRILPAALKIPSILHLEQLNQRLKSEVNERMKHEELLEKQQEILESQVALRTQELANKNGELEELIITLQEKQYFIENVTDLLPHLIYVHDIEHEKYIYTNKSLYHILGYHAEELATMGEKVVERIIHPQDLAIVQQSHSHFKNDPSDKSKVIVYRIVTKGGKVKWLEANDRPFKRKPSGEVQQIIGIGIDITDRIIMQQEQERAYRQLAQSEEAMRDINIQLQEAVKKEQEASLSTKQAYQNLQRTQEQLVQQEKMASLGQLTGGIAHEINNPINFIKNGNEILKEYLVNSAQLINAYQELKNHCTNPALVKICTELEHEIEWPDCVEEATIIAQEITKGARRVTKIVRNLKSFSQEGKNRAIDLLYMHQSIDIVCDLLSHQLMNINLTKNYQATDDCVNGNQSQINQVLMNLLLNAIQALNHEGEITMQSTSNSQEITITIMDNGPGIPEEIRNDIFNPFFTTKDVGNGTGLGLSIAYGIIADHGGTIKVSDNENGGAVLEVTLPLHGI